MEKDTHVHVALERLHWALLQCLRRHNSHLLPGKTLTTCLIARGNGYPDLEKSGTREAAQSWKPRTPTTPSCVTLGYLFKLLSFNLLKRKMRGKLLNPKDDCIGKWDIKSLTLSQGHSKHPNVDLFLPYLQSFILWYQQVGINSTINYSLRMPKDFLVLSLWHVYTSVYVYSFCV